jgi:serine/threonine-protein kinase mTOR
MHASSARPQVYTPLSRKLFHAAFVSCWFELAEAYQEALMRALEAAFRSPSIPPETLQMLLDLAEVMLSKHN